MLILRSYIVKAIVVIVILLPSVIGFRVCGFILSTKISFKIVSIATLPPLAVIDILCSVSMTPRRPVCFCMSEHFSANAGSMLAECWHAFRACDACVCLE